MHLYAFNACNAIKAFLCRLDLFSFDQMQLYAFMCLYMLLIAFICHFMPLQQFYAFNAFHAFFKAFLCRLSLCMPL